MSQENVEIIRRFFEHFLATGDVPEEMFAPDFVWDLSTFRGWPEQQRYEGVDGLRAFLRDWAQAWDDWEAEVEALHDAGERVVSVVHLRGLSKASGVAVETLLAHVWTLRDGLATCGALYADPAEALKAVGLEE
jgi:ketosteroid isomerase-like protein